MSKIDCVHLMCFTLAPLCNFERVYVAFFHTPSRYNKDITKYICIFIFIYIDILFKSCVQCI